MPSEERRVAPETCVDGSHCRFALLAEALGEVVYEHDLRSGRIVWYGALEALLGLTPAALGDTPKAWLDRVHAQDRPATEQAFERALRAGGTFDHQYRVVHVDGHASWVHDRGAVERQADGVPRRMVGVVTRVDEQRRAQRELRDAHAFLEAIVEHLPNMVFVKDAAELRFVRFNRAGEDLLGWSRHQLIGKNDYDFFPANEADHFTSKDRAVLQSGELLDIPEEVIHTAHGRRWLHTRKVPVIGDGGVPLYLLGISEDITEKRDREAELARLNEDLARSNADLQHFAYVASHDLQEPLRTIASYLQLIERRYTDQLDDEGREFIAFAVAGVRRLRALIEGLLAFSRAGTRTLTRDDVDLGALLAQVRGDLEAAIADAGATLTWSDLPTVRGDAVQLGQLFQNLVGNALKFRGAEPPTVHVSAERRDGGWHVRVRDNGIGIAPGDRERIFGLFARLHAVGAYPGAGIGLAICRRIAERHGGTIEVDSTEGQGTTFVVTLPE